MRKLITLVLFPLILIGCSEDTSQPESKQNVKQAEPPETTLTAEELAMPLNTPISEVATQKNNDFAEETEISEANMTSSGVKELEWDELMPKDFRIEELLEQINAGDIADDDPRIDEAMAKIKEMYSRAPVVDELNNETIKLAGFVVPLDMDGKQTTDFLLVPYYGACIHVPPPPANQTVYVSGHKKELELYDTVWVTGQLKVQRSENELGDSGYTIEATDISPYE